MQKKEEACEGEEILLIPEGRLTVQEVDQLETFLN